MKTDICKDIGCADRNCKNCYVVTDEMDTIKAEFAIFFSEVESNLPKTRAMAEVGKEKIAQALFPAFIQIRKYWKK